MATIWISEFVTLPVVSGTNVQAPLMPPVAEQSFTFTTATSSSAFNATTRLVRVMVSAQGHINLAGTATTSNLPLAASAAEYFAVVPGATLSVIVGS